jgi:protein-tyrosine phosphatase
MQTLTAFKASLNANEPDTGLSVQLKSLWYDAKGNWSLAHQQVDHLSDKESAWVHAYLHRKEGDPGNANYWYRKADKVRPDVSLAQEWETLVLNFLK